MKYFNGSSVHRFYSNFPHDRCALKDDYLWFSHYSHLNDPFEDVYIKNALQQPKGSWSKEEAYDLYRKMNKTSLSPEEIENDLVRFEMEQSFDERFKIIMERTYELSKSLFNNYVDKSKVCCLTVDEIESNVSALSNRLMWSHYADGLRGFCVEFNSSELMRSLDMKQDVKFSTHEIQYTDLVPANFEFMLSSTFEALNRTGDFIGTDYFIGSLLTYKSSEWKYENEVRLVCDGESKQFYCPSSIRTITVGEKMPADEFEQLLSVLRGNEGIRCKIFKAKINIENFELERELVCDLAQ